MGTTTAQKKLFFNLKKIKSQLSAENDAELKPEHVNKISKALGDTDKLPITLSVWMPILIIFILSSVGLIHVNQK